jgi:septation ring formation regulator EzrA
MIKLNEFKIEADLNEKINEFGVLSDEIDRVKSKLSNLSQKYKVIENELRPLLEELHKQNQKSLKTKKYLITLKRLGFTRDNYKYKQAFQTALTKVNTQTQKILDEVLKQTKTVSNVVSTIGVQKLSESIVSRMLNKLFSSFKRFIVPLKRRTNSITELNGLLKRMI